MKWTREFSNDFDGTDMVTAKYTADGRLGQFTITREHFAHGPTLFTWVLRSPDGSIDHEDEYETLRAAKRSADWVNRQVADHPVTFRAQWDAAFDPSAWGDGWDDGEDLPTPPPVDWEPPEPESMPVEEFLAQHSPSDGPRWPIVFDYIDVNHAGNWERFVASIAADGILTPVVVFDGEVWNGHHRVWAAHQTRREVRFYRCATAQEADWLHAVQSADESGWNAVDETALENPRRESNPEPAT